MHSGFTKVIQPAGHTNVSQPTNHATGGGDGDVKKKLTTTLRRSPRKLKALKCRLTQIHGSYEPDRLHVCLLSKSITSFLVCFTSEHSYLYSFV